MNWKSLTLAFLAVSPCAALASYELLMYGTGSDGYVQRIDPVSGALLGRIGQGYLSYAGSVALEGNTGNILVADLATRRVVRFNYSTGLFVNSFSLAVGPVGITTIADGSIVVSDNGSGVIRRYSSTGSILNAINTGAAAYSVVTLANGSTLAIGYDGKIRRLNFANSSFVTESFTMAGTSVFGAGASGNKVAQINFTDLGTTQMFQANAVGNYSTGPTYDLLAAEANSMVGRGAAFGHGGVVYATAKDQTAGKNYLYSWDPNAGLFATRREIPFVSELSAQMAIVVAPEPVTMVAMGLGLAVLVRRRRA